MPKTDIERLSDDAAIWIFGITPAVDAAQTDSVLQQVDRFLEQWAAHRVPVLSGREVREGSFLIVAAEKNSETSGCSIDAMFGTVRGLERAGLDVVDLLAGMDAAPPVSTVLLTRATGERAVVSVNATATAGVRVPADAALDDLLDGAAVLLVDGHHLEVAVALAARARRRGVPVVLDGGSWKPGLERLLRHVDHAVLSADFRLDAAADAAPPDGGPGAGSSPW